MYKILFLVLAISLFIIFFMFKKYFSAQEIFLRKSIEQLEFEKKVLENKFEKITEAFQKTEQELLANNQNKLQIQERLASATEENKALRTVIKELQKQQSHNKDDIIIEYTAKK
ncbi:hypothetical protein [Algoriphagus sp.]|uniref:hypothetical protein n=1 Tax=Algoriphagus sp. TaxID=1872435 RepID=UPI003F701DC7